MASHKFVALDSWRGIAALTVAFGHLKTSGFLSTLPVASGSYRFVDFFFVLSGFVIAHSSGVRIASKRGEIWPFFIRRIARLWPLHLFVLGLFAAYRVLLAIAKILGLRAGSAAFEGEFALAWLPANLTMTQAWGFLPMATWNEPAWSISAEFAAYITFALCHAAFGARGWIALAVIGALAAMFTLLHPRVMQATYDLALVRCLLSFSAGVLAYIA
ncbi:acyltransferase family protein [Sphingomonas baiyangensis]|uniref:Acyltransferase n=1 Tax=Sphingomonas baiyangensis TaxID=2572576 RepID=A0A4U1L344_9SPHN|nr:acyltransferase [Sphingomonas baiyangensis]TKD50485.1 acyltransferase [Sphingomonas baiyangensis]